MIAVLFLFIALIGIVILTPLANLLNDSYGSKLEQYIISNNPKNTYDVERLTNEYQEKEQRTFL